MSSTVANTNATKSLAEISEAVRSGTIDARTLWDQSLRQAQTHKELNSVAYLAPEAPAPSATGALAGITLGIKDNIHVAGMPSSAGTPMLKGHVPHSHAPIIQRLLDAGAVVVAKNTMHEMAMGSTCGVTPEGMVHNAHDPSRIPGGSSGGTGTAIAAGIVQAGLGTDTGGSVRVPAAFNGISGLRPTTGRYPDGGVTPLCRSRDTTGPMAHTVADIALLDAVITGLPDTQLVAPEPQSLRLGIPSTFFTEDLDEEVSALFDAALRKLRIAGIELVSVDVSRIVELSVDFGMPLVFAEAGPELSAYLAENVPEVSLNQLVEQIAAPDVKEIFTASILPKVPAGVYATAKETQQLLQQAYAEIYSANLLDALVFPTTPTVAPKTTDTSTFELNGRQVPTFLTCIRNCSPGSVAGVPGVTVPMGKGPSGLPAGLALDGPVCDDRALLGVALVIERLLIDTD